VIDATTACEVQRPPKGSHISVVEYAVVSPVGVDVFCDSERIARAKVKMSARLRNIAVGVAWDESGFVGDWDPAFCRWARGELSSRSRKKDTETRAQIQFPKSHRGDRGSLGFKYTPRSWTLVAAHAVHHCPCESNCPPS
jgi:hypothetical protein